MEFPISPDDNSKRLFSLNSIFQRELGWFDERQFRLRFSASAPPLLALARTLKHHRGCVNAVNWSYNGKYIISGSDDQDLCIWDYESARTAPLKAISTGHTANIFGALFMPETNLTSPTIASCAGDGTVRVFTTRLFEGGLADREATRVFRQHESRVKRISAVDPHSLLSCSEDGTVRLFDIRAPILETGQAVVDLPSLGEQLEFNCLALNGHLFCVGADDPVLRVFDLRRPGITLKRFAPPSLMSARSQFSMRGQITGTAFKGTKLLASYTADHIYLFDLNETAEVLDESDGHSDENQEDSMEGLVSEADSDQPPPVPNGQRQQQARFSCSYSGHVNIQTVKSVNFFGPEQSHVVSGSDCGRIFIWETKTGRLVHLFQGDRHVVNVLEGHPFAPILATVGIENDVKIWEPILPERAKLAEAEQVVARNRERVQEESNRPNIPFRLLRQLVRGRLRQQRAQAGRRTAEGEEIQDEDEEESDDDDEEEHDEDEGDEDGELDCRPS